MEKEMTDIFAQQIESRYSLPAPTVYLAGPIRGLSYDTSQDWRGWAGMIFYNVGILPFSPMRHKHFLKDKTSMPYSDESNVLASAKGIMTRDRSDVMRCDLVEA
jgi:hypothetical protein